MNYKALKHSKELICHLHKSKNVRFEKMEEEQAERTLIKYNYINVITPFKHCFHEEELIEENINGDLRMKHYYSKLTDFSEYFALFSAERSDYVIAYNAISHFELMFKSQVFYHFMKRYSVTNEASALHAFNICLGKVDKLKINSTGTPDEIEYRKKRMKKSIGKQKAYLRGYGDTDKATNIYVLFDRMNLSDVLNIYMTFRAIDKKSIFDMMSEEALTFNLNIHKGFEDKIFNLVSIRNCIMHFNSIEVLFNFSDYKNKTRRTRKSKATYEALYKWLLYTGKVKSYQV